MTASPYPARPPSRWGAGRIIALVIGLLLLIPCLGLLAGGGVLLWADGNRRTSDGYLMSDPETFSTPGFAVASDRLNLSTGADWLPVSSALGSARIEVTGTDPSSEIFVGIAPASDVSGYLNGVRRTVIDDLGSGLGTSGQTQVEGGVPAAPPGDETFWTEQASGAGTQELSWRPAAGNWVLVVMNADGSAQVSVTGRVGATVPSLSGLGWGLLISGAIGTLIAALLLVLAFRRRPGRPVPPSPGAPATGAPSPGTPATGAPAEPGWAPPAPRAAADGAPAPQARSGPADAV